MSKAGAPKGNGNAKKGKHSRQIFSFSGPTYDLLLEALACEGNTDPSKQEIQNAIYYAIRQVYGHKLEDDQPFIV